MSKRGDQMLLKRGNGATPEVFTAIGGLRTKSMKINGETVDVTSADDTQKWRQLLEGAGVKSVSISGAGVFKSGTIAASVNADVLGQLIKNWQVIVPGLGTFEMPTQASEMEYAGEHNGELTYSLTLESAGDVDFEAE